MRATSLNDLLSFEKHFEDASIQFLSDASGVACFPATGNDYLITPRLEVIFNHNGAELPNDAPIESDPELGAEYLKHEGVFEVAIVTDFALEQARDLHLALVGTVRKELLRTSSNWNQENLPYYALKFLRPSGSSRDTDGDLQRTVLSYDLKFLIRSDAFPS
jgi:hypothetical protein